MGNKENSSASQNVAGKSNKRKPFYRRKKNSGSSGNEKPSKAVREYKFYLHDSAQRKSSESFGKIKESIIMKIQNTFVNPIAIAESLSLGVKKIYNKPVMRRSNDANASIREDENTQFLEEWKLDFLSDTSISIITSAHHRLIVNFLDSRG